MSKKIENYRIEGAPDWVHFLKESGSGNDTVPVTCDDNPDPVPRSAEFYFVNDSTGIRIPVSIQQAGATIYYSVEVNKRFFKNCPVDYADSVGVLYNVPAGKYTSLISQADANAKAIAEADANGPAKAEAEGVCVQITFHNTRQCASATKECGPDESGSTETYCIDANTYSSNVSQVDADNRALQAARDGAQAYANRVGTCTTSTWYNDRQCGSVQRNNCEPGYTGTTVEYCVSAGTYSSNISKSDANQKAIDDVNRNKQQYANDNGECIQDEAEWTDTGNTKCASSSSASDGSGCNPFKQQKDQFNNYRWVTGSHSCSQSANWVATGETKCASSADAADGSGTTEYRRERDDARCSSTYQQYRWTATGSTCDGSWTDTGNTKCASSADAADGSGCNPYKEQVNSLSGSKKWVAGTHSCVVSANWVDKSPLETKFSGSSSNSETSGECYGWKKQIDNAQCSVTYNQEKWVRHSSIDKSTAANWVTTGTHKCSSSSTDSEAGGTGYYWEEVRDTNVCSSTYNTTKFRRNSELDGECEPVWVRLSGKIDVHWNIDSNSKALIATCDPNIAVTSSGRSGELGFRLVLTERNLGELDSTTFEIVTGGLWTHSQTIGSGSNAPMGDYTVSLEITNNGGFETVYNNIVMNGNTYRVS